MVYTAKFPDTGIGLEPIQILGNEFMQMNAGSFFFTLNDEF